MRVEGGGSGRKRRGSDVEEEEEVTEWKSTATPSYWQDIPVIEEPCRRKRKYELEKRTKTTFTLDKNKASLKVKYSSSKMEETKSAEMSEDRARAISEMPYSEHFDESEVIHAVDFLRDTLRPMGYRLYEDCKVCWRSLASHEPNEECEKKEKESSAVFVQRQLARLTDGFAKLDRERSEQEKKQLQKRVEQLSKELGETRSELLMQSEDRLVARNLLMDISLEQVSKGKKSKKEDMKKKMEEIEEYFGSDWQTLMKDVELVKQPHRATAEDTSGSSNWSEKGPNEDIEMRRRSGLTMEELKRRFGHGEYQELDYEPEMEGADSGRVERPPPGRKIVFKETAEVFGGNDRRDNQNDDRRSDHRNDRRDSSKEGQRSGHSTPSPSPRKEGKKKKSRRRWRDERRRSSRRDSSSPSSSPSSSSSDSSDSKNEKKERRKKRAEEKITAKETKQLREGGAKVWPGLKELDEVGLELKHQTGGSVVGGSPKMSVVKELIKITESIRFGQKDQGESEYSAFKRHVKDFVSAMENITTKETTIYDITACFCHKNMRWNHTLEPLKRKEAHFTSFMHFLEEFKNRKWPGERHQQLIEAERCKQMKNESIDTYYERFKSAVEDLNWKPENETEWFISGLFDEEVKKHVQLHDYPDRSLEAVKEYAIDFLGRREVGVAMSQRRNAQPAATTYAAGASTQRRRGASASAASASIGRGRGATPSGRGGARSRTPGPRGRGGRGGRSHSSAATTYGSYGKSKGQRKAAALNWMKANGIKGCPACFKPHMMQDDFSTCVNICPFCGRKYEKNENRHFAPECSKRPNQRFECMKKVSEAQARE